MLQTCPHCLTLINVSTEDLSENDGLLTCTHCHARFTVSKFEDLKVKPDDAVAAPMISDTARRDLLESSLEAPAKQRSGLLLWGFVSLVLALLLAGQYIYFERNSLADHANLRPWLVTFCHYARCELKPIREPERIRILSREVRSHPTIKNTLLIELELINDAAFRQPWPTLQLTFSDINGKMVARRSFTPDEYLQNNQVLKDGMPSNIPASVDLVLVDPGPKAVNFEFEFH